MNPPPAPDYRDRMAGLVVFGIGEIAIGGFCGLAILAIMMGRVASVAAGGRTAAPPSIVPAAALYGILGSVFISLGIGSVLARRWARALWLCLSGLGLCCGLLACIWMVMILPRAFAVMASTANPSLPPGAMAAVKALMVGGVLVMYVAIPGALFLFYRSPNVKRTCEVRDPVARWTDNCPPPVLALSLMSGAGSVALLALVSRFRGYPVMGFFVDGIARYFIAAIFAGALLYVAWGFYQLQIRAWWVALGMEVLGVASNVITFWWSDLSEVYGKMGLDPRTAALTVQLVSDPPEKWLLTLSVIPWAIWLLCVRRYFIAHPPPPLLAQRDSKLSF
jgi:hypothetical protein